MIVCEYDFMMPDRKNADYSQSELDYYAWIPAGSDLPSHRLSLRKNLITGDYEVYRRFYQQRLVSRGAVTVITGDDTGQEQVAFKNKDLGAAVSFADGEWKKYHGNDKDPDQICLHKPPTQHWLCEKLKKAFAGKAMVRRRTISYDRFQQEKDKWLSNGWEILAMPSEFPNKDKITLRKVS